MSAATMAKLVDLDGYIYGAEHKPQPCYTCAAGKPVSEHGGWQSWGTPNPDCEACQRNVASFTVPEDQRHGLMLRVLHQEFEAVLLGDVGTLTEERDLDMYVVRDYVVQLVDLLHAQLPEDERRAT